MPSKPLALITGASAGIGATFARQLAARGYSLILVARRRDRLEQLASELGSAEVIAADLTDPAQLKTVEDRLRATPPVDLLVNNAGFGISGRFWDTEVDAQEQMHRLHIVTTMRLTHAALSVMVPRQQGAVINVSSVAAFVASPGSVTYGATKCWMNRFTEGLYLELGRLSSPVRIQALCPGFTRSEFHDVARIDPATVPVSLWTTADDVVAASLAGLERNKLFVVPGWRYKLLVRALAVLPMPLIRAAAIRTARRRGHK
ncbi:MAG TPA: SDR family oxidoreductase [Candidatus Sulfopaludibacter sp.]|nr:SDR family oxidoreductase [Candidatus Sulfopaludibacter sp.]